MPKPRRRKTVVDEEGTTGTTATTTTGGSRNKRGRKTTVDDEGGTTAGGEGGGLRFKKKEKKKETPPAPTANLAAEKVHVRRKKSKSTEPQEKPRVDMDKSIMAATCVVPVDAPPELQDAFVDPERDVRDISGKDPENMTETQMKNLRAFITQYEEVGVKGLLDEFETIKSYNIVPFKVDAHESNPTKNRYKDIFCIDKTRIKLKGKKGADYIHANHVKGTPFLNTFVTTQGPIEATVNDFWRLVVQEKVGYIFMLCSIIELEKKKCEQYYPEVMGEAMKYGEVSVKLVSTHTDGHFVNSKFELVAKGIKRYIYHHYWKNWPDRGVPMTAMAGLRLLRHARLTNYTTIVHCSAGVGRTGTLVAIEWMLQKVISTPPPYDMKEMLKEMRNQRAHAIQTAPQYVYIAFTIYRLLATKDSSSIPGFMQFSNDMQTHTGVKFDGGGVGGTKTGATKTTGTVAKTGMSAK